MFQNDCTRLSRAIQAGYFPSIFKGFKFSIGSRACGYVDNFRRPLRVGLTRA